ncbi:hypothetical protein K7G19_10665 [Cupriavidus sp. DB3]|uniref:hypothetical protein n=1 Tax=Cupriavidus sp. DB3 TaxID=2873259 RepID=UPI001CF4ACAB|nr:hypothetical protein [Cupriavidus sp. DB3]MCA7084067.1 hypothetical protein [Cupriavidus sp. DB3]
MQELDSARQQGLMPKDRYLVLSLGVQLAPSLPVIDVPSDYWPSEEDSLAALAALDVEVVFSEGERFGRLRDLCSRILAAEPRRLLLMAMNDKPALMALKKGVTWH